MMQVLAVIHGLYGLDGIIIPLPRDTLPNTKMYSARPAVAAIVQEYAGQLYFGVILASYYLARRVNPYI